ncbi:MAG: hypothetical protein QOG39_2003, partial [Acidimicrobiaceae bacterium]
PSRGLYDAVVIPDQAAAFIRFRQLF